MNPDTAKIVEKGHSIRNTRRSRKPSMPCRLISSTMTSNVLSRNNIRPDGRRSPYVSGGGHLPVAPLCMRVALCREETVNFKTKQNQPAIKN